MITINCSLSFAAFDNEGVFIAEVEGTEVALVVLTLEQRRLVTRQ